MGSDSIADFLLGAIDPERYKANDLLTASGVAAWMGCSVKSVCGWLHRHKIEPADVPGRTKRYSAGDVQVAIRRSRAAGEAE